MDIFNGEGGGAEDHHLRLHHHHKHQPRDDHDQNHDEYVEPQHQHHDGLKVDPSDRRERVQRIIILVSIIILSIVIITKS